MRTITLTDEEYSLLCLTLGYAIGAMNRDEREALAQSVMDLFVKIRDTSVPQ